MTPQTQPASSHRVRAQLLRKVSGSTGLDRTMRKAVRVLAEAGIPSLVVGGYAVQENGYARFTSDVDIVVPDVALARAALTVAGFRENPGSTMTLTDRATKIEVKLIAGGSAMDCGPLAFPMPRQISTDLAVVDLRTLIEMKLSSYLGSPVSRLQDLADVIALMQANAMPQDFSLHEAVRETYLDTWNGLDEEKSR